MDRESLRAASAGAAAVTLLAPGIAVTFGLLEGMVAGLIIAGGFFLLATARKSRVEAI